MVCLETTGSGKWLEWEVWQEINWGYVVEGLEILFMEFEFSEMSSRILK